MMRDFWRYVRHTIRILLQNDVWFLAISVLLLLIVGAWTLTMTEPGQWASVDAIAQAETLGGLLAVFLCAGLLDPETRHGASEIVFSKPLSPGVLLGVRLGLATLLGLLLLLALLGTYQVHYGHADLLKSLLYAIPNFLFVGMVALTIGQRARTALGGMAVALSFWLWDTTMGMLYNPLFVLPAGAMSAGGPDIGLGVNPVLNKAVLLLCAAALFMLNARSLSRSGWEAGPPTGRGLIGRLATPAKVVGVLAFYFWSGALAKLWTAELMPPTTGWASPNLNARPGMGQVLIGSNLGYEQLMEVYGPVPMGRWLGPGVGDFLRGLGSGLDPSTPGYQAQRRRALERAARAPDRWAIHARLELAAMDAFPAPFQNPAPFEFAGRPPDEPAARAEPAWVTVGLADPDRWWIIRQPAGANLPLADRRCAQVLDGSPPPALAAEALQLRAGLAAMGWHFRAEAAFLRELLEDYPSTQPAGSDVGQFSQELAQGGRADEAVALCRHVMLRQPPANRPWLALQLAQLQGQTGDVAGAKATLRRELRDWDRLGMPRSARGDDPGTQMDRALAVLDKHQGRPEMAPSLPPSPEATPGFSVHTRLLADGKPLVGEAVALVPMAMAGQCLPPPASMHWQMPRPPGRYPPVARGEGMGYNDPFQPWSLDSLESYLRAHPSFIARSGARGEVQWASIPAGAYAVLLRLASRTVPDARNLAPLPPSGPLIVAGPNTRLPDVQLVARISIVRSQTQAGIPALRWGSVHGAARYRVVLRLDSDAERPPMLAEPAGAGSAAIDPGVVWWRDGIRGTSAQLTAAGFVGPAANTRSNGLRFGIPYAWSVEAFDGSGHPLRISDGLLPSQSIGGLEWTALQPLRPKGKGRPSHLLTAWRPFGLDFQPQQEFDSPFLQFLMFRQSRSFQKLLAVRKARIRFARGFPSLVSNGQGLPPRAPLQMALPNQPQSLAQAGTGGLTGVPPNLPPALLAQLRRMQAMAPPGTGGPGMAPGGVAPGGPVPPGLPPGMRLPAGVPPGPPGAGVQSGRVPAGGSVPGGRRAGEPPFGMPPGMARAGQSQMPAVPAMGPGGRSTQGGSLPMPGARLPHLPGTGGRQAGRTRSGGYADVGRQANSQAARPPAGNILMSIPLVTFGPESASEWQAQPGAGPAPDTRPGLPLQGETSLTPRVPLQLPPHTRRVVVSLDGAATGDLRLRDAAGDQRRVPLWLASAGHLAATVPDESWALAGLTLAPRAGAAGRLRTLEAEVAPSPGIFTLATRRADGLALAIFNLGAAPEHLAIAASPDAGEPEMSFDLAPAGRFELHLPAGATVATLWRQGQPAAVTWPP